MTIKVVHRADVDATIVEVDGELDLDSAPRLRAVLDDAVDRGDMRIVVDAANLGFCDSVGLSVLLTTHFNCEARGGYLRLAAPNDQLLHLLSVVGLSAHVISYRTVPGALTGDQEQIMTVAVDPL